MNRRERPRERFVQQSVRRRAARRSRNVCAKRQARGRALMGRSAGSRRAHHASRDQAENLARTGVMEAAASEAPQRATRSSAKSNEEQPELGGLL
jgi:hypothetical protein